MKKKTFLLSLVLVCTLFFAAGCGRRMNSATDGTDRNSSGTAIEENTNEEPHSTMPSDGTPGSGTVMDGITEGVDDAVDGITDGVDDMVNGVNDTIEDPTGRKETTVNPR